MYTILFLYFLVHLSFVLSQCVLDQMACQSECAGRMDRVKQCAISDQATCALKVGC